jgi:hypothetical protein
MLKIRRAVFAGIQMSEPMAGPRYSAAHSNNLVTSTLGAMQRLKSWLGLDAPRKQTDAQQPASPSISGENVPYP